MNKKQLVLVILITIVVVWSADLLVGNYLSARLATSNFARKFNLFNPQAPIVVTNRETVRVNTNNDIVQTAQNAKSKISVVVYFEGQQLVTSGAAVNWTNDGYFVSTKTAFSETDKVYAVMTNGGDIYPIEQMISDTASNLVIIQTSAQNLAVLDPSDVSDGRVGDQIVAINNSLGNEETRFSTGFVSRIPKDSSGLVQESDLVSNSFGLQTLQPLLPGTPILNLSGRLMGVWDGKSVVTSADIRNLVNDFLANNKQIIRPSFGFSYQLLSEAEAKALQTVSGARIMGVAGNKSASIAGLKVGDVITEIDNQKVEAGKILDTQLRQVSPGETIRIVFYRAGVSQSVDLNVSTLK